MVLVNVDYAPKLHARCRDKGVEQLILGWKNKRHTGDIFLDIRPEMQQKMKQPSTYPLGGHADGCVLHQNFHLILGGSSSVSFSRLHSDSPYTIFTPFRRGVVWNYMKLYSGYLYGKHAEIKNYRYLWGDIEI